MATYRHWSVSLWRDPDDVSHCRILSPDKTEWRLISATHCGWRLCFVTHHCYGSWHAYEKNEIIPLKQQMSLIQAFALNNVSNPPNFRSRWNGRSLNTKLATKNHNTRVTTANRNKMVSPHQPGIGKHYQTKFNNKRSVSIPAWSNRDRTAKETIEKCVN